MLQIAIKTNETWLICGGRDFVNQEIFDQVMSQLLGMFGCPEIVIHGDAKGADAMGAAWADRMAIRNIAVPADWQMHGKAAGPIRNEQMLDHKPQRVVAFPGGAGTTDMIRRAKKRMPEITVIEIKADSHRD